MAKMGQTEFTIVRLLGRIAFFMQVVDHQLRDLAIILHHQNIRRSVHTMSPGIFTSKVKRTHRPPQAERDRSIWPR